MVVVDEQLQARTPNKIGGQHLDQVDDGDAGQDEATTTSAHRPSLFGHHLHFSHQSSTPTPPSTTSSPPSTFSRNNSPTPLPGPCVVLPRPVRPNTSLSSALPAYPPLHHHHHATTTATTTAAAYPYPAYYPLASFANNPSAGATTSSSTSPCSNASTLPPPVPMLTTPGAGPVIDLQFLSQLYLQASPYLLPGLFSTATATTSSSTSSSSSTTMSGGHHQAGVFAQSAGQQAPPPGYHPGIHLQQQVFHQAMALAHLHPLPHHQHQQQQHISPPASVHRESTALTPLTPARSLDGHVPNHQHHHNHQRHQSAGFSAGGDRMSALESILARAERHAQEENARNLARGIKREKSGYGDDYASPSRSDRLKRRRTDSNSSDSDYSPSSAGGQRRTQSDDDEHHHRGHPTFTSSSSGSSDDDEDDENGGGARRSAGKHQGVVGTGMREMLYKRRQASPKQVVLLEQVFAVEPIPTSATKLRLSEVLNMSPKRVTVWFKNKRARQKKKGIPLPNSCTTATATTATSSPGGPTTTTSVRTSPIDRKFPTSSASSSSSTTTASSSPPARRRGDQHLTFHYFADRDSDDSAGAAP